MTATSFRTTNRKPFGALLILLVFAVGLVFASSPAQTHISFTVGDLNLKPGERIVSFDLKGSAAMFQSLASLPPGWSLQIDNDPSWMTSTTGNIHVGAAALSEKQFSNLKFGTTKNEFGALKFGITGTVTITTDFAQTRQIVLSSNNIHFE